MQEKAEILKKFIESLVFEGWNQQTLEKSIESAGLDKSQLAILYPGGIAEFTQEFIDGCNKQALEISAEPSFTKLKTQEKVRELIFSRIKTYHFKLQNLEALKKFMAYNVKPFQLGESLKNIYDFSSDVWYTIGDKSTDFSFYTKRLSLSMIYSKSMLYSLNDKSENLHSTQKFIQNSIDGLMKINKLKSKIKNFKLPTKRF
jgi:ubiquinone biosynthesis protein COQ9